MDCGRTYRSRGHRLYLPLKFSGRTDWPRVRNRLTQILESKKKSGTPLIDLTESNPTRCGFGYLTPELLKPLSDPGNLAYEPDPHGLRKAREEICGYYSEKGVSLHADQIFLTAGTGEAYAFLFRLLCDPGDPVLLPRPGYPLLDYLADLNDVKPVFYDLSYQDAWRMDEKSFPKHFFKTKAVLVVNPNNPTGNYVTREESAFISGVCLKNQCAVISDEVFFDFSWEGSNQERKSFAGCADALSFTLGGLSKFLGLPQMKLGWIVVNGPRKEKEEAIQRLEIIADTYLSVNTPVQNALPVWFQNYKGIIREIRERCLQNRRFLTQALEAAKPVRLLGGEGGWYAMLSLGGFVSDGSLAVRLLEEYNVLLHPGYFFNTGSGREIVLGLLSPAPVFREGVERLLKCLHF